MIIAGKSKKEKDKLKNVLSEDTKDRIKTQAKESIKKQYNTEKIKNTWSDGYQFGDITKTILNVTDVFNPISKTRNVTEKATNLVTGEGNFFKSSKTKDNIKNIWDDGYQFGDITKTKLDVYKAILGSTGDVVSNMAKGELQTAEGLVDTGRYIILMLLV